MKAVIIGTDLVYDKNGNLNPVEINTNIGMSLSFIEDMDTVWKLDELKVFVLDRGFTKLVYIGPTEVFKLKRKISEMCTDISIEFEHILVNDAAISIPFVEDDENTLILRSSYDTTAILDDTYCANKINYSNLIKEEDFGTGFAYLDENGNLINYITEIIDNGVHPNFILKSSAPHYSGDEYPKLYKVSNQTELNSVLANIPMGFLLTNFHFNSDKLYQGLLTKIRKISILYPPNLESIHIGDYTDVAALKIRENPTYNPTTYEIDNEFVNSYITDKKTFVQPKLMDDDYVVLADGTRKSGLDLQIGDVLKTIDIPNPNEINTSNTHANYGIDLNTFISGTVYSENAVTNKVRVEAITNVVTINFTDTTSWIDTDNSSYLIYKDNEIQFKSIKDLEAGDIVLLIDTNSAASVEVIQKIVQSIIKTKEIFEGWLITVERQHLFLTATEGPNNMAPSFVAIEHNISCKSPKGCTTPPENCCYKSQCAVCLSP